MTNREPWRVSTKNGLDSKKRLEGSARICAPRLTVNEASFPLVDCLAQVQPVLLTNRELEHHQLHERQFPMPLVS